MLKIKEVLSNNLTHKVFVASLCLICFFLYFGSLNNNFVLDDTILIVKNPLIRSLKSLPLIFRSSLYDYSAILLKPYTRMYRPLQLLTYSVDYRIWRLNPWGFHLSNVFLHLLNSILVYYLLLIIFKNNVLSQVVGLLFLVHPIHTSVVLYISGRADLLVCFFMLLSMMMFLKFIKLKSKICYAMSLVFALLALFSRENALILFLFIILVLTITKAKFRDYLYVLPFMALDLIYILFRFSLFGSHAIDANFNFMPLSFQILNFLNIIPRYLLLLAVPTNLYLFRTTPFITSLSDIRLLLVAAFTFLSIFLFIKYRKNKIASFSILWFSIGIIPVFMVFNSYYYEFHQAMMAESWQYIPSIGFFIAFSYILNKIGEDLGRLLIICFIIFYSFLTLVNNSFWKDNLALHKNILEHTTEKSPFRVNLISYYIDNGFYKEALSEMNKFSIYNPDFPKLYYVWGIYYLTTGKLDAAIDNFNRDLSKNRASYLTCYCLSICYEKLNQPAKAIEFALESFKLNPLFLDNLIQLGKLYAKEGRPAEAKEYYNLAFEIDPLSGLIKK